MPKKTDSSFAVIIISIIIVLIIIAILELFEACHLSISDI